MHAANTERGFARIGFDDRYGVECSLQESSLATEAAIWFGCNESNARHCVMGKGWVPYEYPAGLEVHTDTRMHLTQAHIKAFLPMLQEFARTGYLPEIEDGVLLTQKNRWMFAMREYSDRLSGYMIFWMLLSFGVGKLVLL